MKTTRFIISLVLLGLILLTAGLALFDLWRGLEEINSALRQASATPPAQQQLLAEQSAALPELWNRLEKRFVLYVSHSTLDHITQLIAELPALARYGEYSHLYSHFDAILALLDDLWQSSLPSYRTLL
ncbi:MAG: DUF4363 family protein [Angelakisella sp.]